MGIAGHLPTIPTSPRSTTDQPAVGPHRLRPAHRMIRSLVSAGKRVANCSKEVYSNLCAIELKYSPLISCLLLKSNINKHLEQFQKPETLLCSGN
jgi:hypothetical protein